MKNKSDLYKQSNPHSVSTNFDRKTEFRVLIGTYEQNYIVTVEAYNLKLALQEAWNYCKDYQLVLQVTREGKIIWRNEHL
jgi:hypothetical protein